MAIPKILGNSVIYTGVTILQRCISFILLPLYTSYLTPADYGITGVVASVSSLLAIFTTMGLESAGSRFYYKYHGEQEYVKRLYGTISCVVIVNSIVFGGIFMLAHKWIVDPLLGEIEYYPCVFVGLLNVIVTPLYLIFQGYLQTIQDGMQYGVNSLLNFITHVFLTIIFVVFFKMGALGVLLATLITSVVFFVYVFVVFLRNQKIGFDKTIMKESYSYSLPLLPHMLANWSNGTIDKLLVNGIRSEADAGLYNIGRQYSSVANTMSIAVNNAYVPWFYDKVNDIEKNLPSIRKMSEMITWIISFLCVIMALFSQEILDVMISNPAYEGVWKVIPFLIASTIFNAIYFFFINVLFLKNTGTVFTVTISTIAINVGLNLWLIPLLGYIGCGIAVMLTYFVKSIIALFISLQKNKKIRFRWFYLYIIGIVSSSISISALFFEGIDMGLSFCVKTLIVISLAVFIYLTYKSEILELLHSFRKK